ncbi:serine/threonine-protein kinase [Myxococcota bacterium]|nr:serine/threonine-protein kinase [Myxococcota bacterium]
MDGKPDKVASYTRTLRLGAGPHAEVWRAQGPRGPVALKIATSAAGRQMLRHEAAILDPLRHPGVVRLEARDLDGAWMAVELVEGGPIDAWARARSHRDVALALSRVAEGLAFLHAHQVVHGDLKPSNVLVDDHDQPRIIDLGLAAIRRDAEDPPARDGFRGTLGFAAPELLQGLPPTPRTDIYALGALAYRLVTGTTPFPTSDPAALAVLPLQTLPLPPSALVPDLPQQLGELVLRMMTRAAPQRPADAGVVAAALRSCVEGTAGPVVLGMLRDRDSLRRMVVQASEGRPVLAVLHGAPGSGRSTLIREATEAARREGMQLVRHQPGQDTAQALEGIVAEARRRPTVVVMDATHDGVPQLAARLFSRRVPGLILVRAPRPIGALLTLGARHLSPSPLSVEETELLLLHLGHDPATAAELHLVSGGRPGALKTLLGRQAMPADISDREREILLFASRGPVPVVDIARRLDLGEHDLLDLLDPLLDRGLLAESADGATVERTS